MKINEYGEIIGEIPEKPKCSCIIDANGRITYICPFHQKFAEKHFTEGLVMQAAVTELQLEDLILQRSELIAKADKLLDYQTLGIFLLEKEIKITRMTEEIIQLEDKLDNIWFALETTVRKRV